MSSVTSLLFLKKIERPAQVPVLITRDSPLLCMSQWWYMRSSFLLLSRVLAWAGDIPSPMVRRRLNSPYSTPLGSCPVIVMRFSEGSTAKLPGSLSAAPPFSVVRWRWGSAQSGSTLATAIPKISLAARASSRCAVTITVPSPVIA